MVKYYNLARFLGITHKHPRAIGIYRAYISGFPMTGYVGIGVHPCLSPDGLFVVPLLAIFKNPRLPNTCLEGALGRFWGSKYLLTFGVWKPREKKDLPQISQNWFSDTVTQLSN